MCNKVCITCCDIYCPWKQRWLNEEARAEWEEEHRLSKDFTSMQELIADLHQPEQDRKEWGIAKE